LRVCIGCLRKRPALVTAYPDILMATG
jgi:hypothetical protein